MRACDCYGKVNEELKRENTRLLGCFRLTTGEVFPILCTEQIERGRGKQKAVQVVPSFCPWCGVSNQREEEES